MKLFIYEKEINIGDTRMRKTIYQNLYLITHFKRTRFQANKKDMIIQKKIRYKE